MILLLNSEEFRIIKDDYSEAGIPESAKEVLYIVLHQLLHLYITVYKTGNNEESQETAFKTLSEVDRIVLLNRLNFEITNNDIKLFQKSSEYEMLLEAFIPSVENNEIDPQLSELNTKLTQLIKIIEILSFTNSLGSSSDDKNNIEFASKQLREFASSDKIITFSRYLTPWLAQILLSFDNVDIYHREPVLINRGLVASTYRNVDNVKEYLMFIYVFSKSGKYSPKMLPLTESFIENIRLGLRHHWPINENLEDFYREYDRVIKNKNSKILLIGDGFLSLKFISDVQRRIGTLFICDCSAGNYKIFPEKELLSFTNIDKLSKTDLSLLISELLTGEYKNKTVILQSNIIPEDFYHIYRFEQVAVPKFEQMKHILSRVFISLAYEKGMFTIDKNNLKAVYKIMNSSFISRILGYIPSYKDMDRFLNELDSEVDFEDIDFTNAEFWYALYSLIKLKFTSAEGEEVKIKTNRLIEQKTKNETFNAQSNKTDEFDNGYSIYEIRISLDKDTGELQVEPVNPKGEPAYFKPNGLIGLKYIIYLVENYKFPKKIKAQDLLEQINKRHIGKETTKNGKKTEGSRGEHERAEHTIDEAIRYFLKEKLLKKPGFKKYPPIQKHFTCFLDPRSSENIYYFSYKPQFNDTILNITVDPEVVAMEDF